MSLISLGNILVTQFSTHSKTPGEQAVDEERVSTEAHASNMGRRGCRAAEAGWVVPGVSQPYSASKGLLSAPVSASFQVVITQKGILIKEISGRCW